MKAFDENELWLVIDNVIRECEPKDVSELEYLKDLIQERVSNCSRKII